MPCKRVVDVTIDEHFMSEALWTWCEKTTSNPNKCTRVTVKGDIITDHIGQKLAMLLRNSINIQSLHLDKYTIFPNVMDEIVTMVKRPNCQLVTLSLYLYPTFAGCMTLLLNALRANTSVTRLELKHVTINECDGEAMHDALLINTSITFLNIEYMYAVADFQVRQTTLAGEFNPPKDKKIKPPDVIMEGIWEALVHNSCVTHFHAAFTNPSGSAWTQLIAHNHTLTAIEFGHVSGSRNVDDLEALVCAVIQSSTLERIEATMIWINEYTSRILSLTRGLVEFNCSYGSTYPKRECDVRDNFLSQALSINTSLCWFDMHGVHATDQERMDIAHATHSHLALQSLDMSIQQSTNVTERVLEVLSDRPVVLSKLELPAPYDRIAFQQKRIKTSQREYMLARYSSVWYVW